MTVKALNDGLQSGETKSNDFIADEMFSGACPAYFNTVYVAGSMVGNIAFTNVYPTGSVTVQKKVTFEVAGSPYGEGITYEFTCAGAITGGQLVDISGGLAVAAAANSSVDGFAYGTAKYTSGTTATIPVVVYGLKYFTACANIGNDEYALTGSVAHMVQSGALGAGNVVGKCVKAAASGAIALVFVGKI